MKNEKLTDAQKQFLIEAEAGGFGIAYDADGNPYAMGADCTGNLFSMAVEERPDGDGASLYYLRD